MNLFTLYAKLGLDSSGYESGINKALSGAKAVGKGITLAVGAAATGIGALVKESVNQYGQFEQLVGGVQTLFGKSAQKVLDDSQKAFADAGMSMNQYMETSIQSAASLINSLDGDQAKAAELMNVSIIDMADNVNKMGTTMEAVQNAYRGFSRGNFTMLDNLALGFAGTKEGMQQLLNKAKKISGIKYDISSYSDIVQAIHVVQTEMGITGTTAKEAAGTIQGSAGSVKAAWSNLVVSLATEKADDVALSDTIAAFVNSAVTMLNNLLPTVERALEGVGELIEKAVPEIMDRLPELVNKVIPKLIASGANMIQSILNGMKSNSKVIFRGIVDILKTIAEACFENLPTLIELALQLIIDVINGITESLPELMPLIFEALMQIVEIITNQDTLNSILESVINLLIALGDEVLANIDILIEAFLRCQEALIMFATNPENLEKIFGLAVRLVIALGTGLIKSIPQLLASFANVIGAIIKNIAQTDWSTVGNEVGKSIWEGMKKAWNTISEWFKEIWDKIKGYIAVIPEFFKTVFTKAYNAIINAFMNIGIFFTNVYKSITDALSKIPEFFKGIFQSAYNKISDIFNKIGSFFSGIWNGVMDGIKSIPEFVRGIFQSAYNKITGIFNKIGGFFSGIWETVVSTFTTVGTQVAEAIGGAFKTAINAAIGVVEGALNLIPGAINGALGAINKIPGVNIPYMNSISLPRLAKGGIVDEPTQAIVGEAGKEAIVPLENNTGWMDKLAEKIGKNSNKGNTFNFTVSITGDINKRDDLEAIADDLMYIMQEKIERQGVAYG